MSTPATATIRPATPEDITTIAAIWRTGWCDGHAGHVPTALEHQRRTGDWHGEVRRRLDATSVAEALTGRVVGFVTVIGDEIEQVYVDASARGTGIAEDLLQHGEQLVEDAGHQTAWLAVATGNQRARRFYERCGWTDDGEYTYTAHVAGQTMPVPVHRYHKGLTPPAQNTPGELPAGIVDLTRACTSHLSGLVEHAAWTGIAWRARTTTVAHLVWIDNAWPPAYARAAGTDGPQAVLTVSSTPEDLAALTATDPQFFRPAWSTRWRHPVLGVRLGDHTDWDHVTELITASYHLVAPKRRITPTKESRS